MLDIRLIREEPDVVRRGLERRHEDPSVVDRIAELDASWRLQLSELERLRAQRNEGSKAIGQTKDPEARQAKIAEMREVSDAVGRLEASVAAAEELLQTTLLTVPNLPAPEVPDGADESENVVVRSVGELPGDEYYRRPHWETGPEMGILDFETGARLSGSRFYVLQGNGARLQRALINWMLDFHTRRGYFEIYPPFLVREECMWNAGQLPKFNDNLYRDAEDDLWLIPTAEVPLTNLHAGDILEADDLPKHYVAYTPCFRREKMSAGRDVRGIKRGHQFDKIEMYKFTRPEESADALAAMLQDGEAILQALELPYRVVELCAGDLGFGSVRTFDLEAYAPGCDEWLEVSSISNFGSFQARRSGIRFRREPGGPTEHVHTLNGSGLALPRTMIAILENYQTDDGRVRVPAVLQERFGGAYL